MAFTDIINQNRNENSFTSRLFEGVLFPGWENNPQSFSIFSKMLVNSSKKNQQTIMKRLKANKKGFEETYLKPWPNTNLKFKTGMVFMELWDVYAAASEQLTASKFSYCNHKEIDKTEIDAVVLCQDENYDEHLLAFELKCYTDLNFEGIKRQNYWLEFYRKNKIIANFHHFAIISYHNLKHAKTVFNKQSNRGITNGLYLITWDDLYVNNYLPEPLFPNERLMLYKHIKKDGTRTRQRYLVKPKRLQLNLQGLQ